MKSLTKILMENKKHEKLTRDQYKSMLDQGHKFTNASLYEPDNAPKGTKFFHVELGKGLVHFKRLHPKSTEN
jgi:hypothetical protein